MRRAGRLMTTDDLELEDTVDGMPLRLVLATKGLLDAASVAWPTAEDIPEAIREPLLELNDIWIQEVAAAIEARADER